MPTNISNAVGTARQFTPQPDAFYQGRLSGLAAIQHSAAQFTNHALVAENLTKLTNAMQNFEFGNDKRQDELGLQRATDLINGSTAEDIMRLNVIDAAQQEGYMDVADNPYFKAHAERLRGEFLSTKARQAYDEKYAELPADSADAEVARYNEFTGKWRQENVKALPMNQVAFDKGFNENGMVNQTILAQEYTKKKIEEGMQVTYIETMAQLGKLKEDFPHMQKDELTAKMNAVLSPSRLMGLDLTTKVKLVTEFGHSMVTTGVLDVERFLQMAQNVTIQTKMDNTRRTLYDLIDPQSLRVQGNHYQAQYYTKEADEFLSHYKNDVNMDRCLQDFESYDNYKQQRLGKYLPQIKSGIEGVRAKKAIEAQKAAAASLNKAYTSSDFAENMRAFEDGTLDLDSNGNAIGSPYLRKADGSKRAPTAAECQEQWLQKYLSIRSSNISDEEKAGVIMKWMKYPPFKDAKNAYLNKLETNLDNITPDNLLADESGALKERTKELLAYSQSDPAAFASVCNKELLEKTAVLQGLYDAKGDMGEALKYYAAGNTAAPEVKAANKNKAYKIIASNPSVSISELGDTEATNFNISTSSQASEVIESLITTYLNCGQSEAYAKQQAYEDFSKRYTIYHGAMIPAKEFKGIGSGNDNHWAQQALFQKVYEYADKIGMNSDHVFMSYNSQHQIFTLSGGGELFPPVPLSYVINQGRYLASKTPVDTGITADEINAERNTYLIGSDEDRTPSEITPPSWISGD